MALSTRVLSNMRVVLKVNCKPQQICINVVAIRCRMCLSMAVGANGNTIPDAVALLSPKDVMNIKKARIAPSSSTSLALTLSTGPVQHNTPDALYAEFAEPVWLRPALHVYPRCTNGFI